MNIRENSVDKIIETNMVMKYPEKDSLKVMRLFCLFLTVEIVITPNNIFKIIIKNPNFISTNEPKLYR